MDLGLTGKRALVTGSTAGIGFAAARALAREGARVTVNGRTHERVSQALASLAGEHPDARLDGVAADLGTAEGCRLLVERLADVDILVNNLGIFEPKPFEEIPDEDWLRFFEVNVMSGVRLTRHYLPGMSRRNWGRVVFVSSESAVQIPVRDDPLRDDQDGPAGRLAWTGRDGRRHRHHGQLRLAGAHRIGGRRATSSTSRGPGRGSATVEREFFQTARPSSLLRRFATADEVAAMIVYVCSPLASATNGAALRVDGGVLRSIA